MATTTLRIIDIHTRNSENIVHVPFDKKFCLTSIDYIDNITLDTFKNINHFPGIINGIDGMNRVFFSFCIEQQIDDRFPKYDIITIYQRFELSDIWMASLNHAKATEHLFKERYYDLYSLMDDQTYDDFYPINEKVKGAIIKLLNTIIDDKMIITSTTFLPIL